MATVPTPRPRVKPAGHVQLLSRPDPVGLLAITVGRERTCYLLERIPVDFGAAFALTKLVMMEVEVFDLTVPDDEAQQIKTVGDAIDYVVRQRVTPAVAR